MFSVYINHFIPTYESGFTNGEVETLLFTIPFQNGNNRDVINATVNSELSNAGNFEITFSPRSNVYNIWRHMRTFVRVDYDGTTIFYGRVLSIDRDMFRNLKLHCEGAYTFFMDSVYEGTSEGTVWTVNEYLQKLIDGHNECMDMESIEDKKIYLGDVPGNYTTYLAINVYANDETDPEQPVKYDYIDTLYAWDPTKLPALQENLFKKDKMVVDNTWVDENGKLKTKQHYKAAVIPIGNVLRIAATTGKTETDTENTETDYTDIPGEIGYLKDDKTKTVCHYPAADYKTEEQEHGGYKYLFPAVQGVNLEQQIKNDTQNFAKGKGYKSVKDWLDSLNKDYAGFMRIRYETEEEKLYLDWYKLYYRPVVSDQTLTVTKNILDLSDTVEVNNIFTHVIGIGKNGIYTGGSGSSNAGGDKHIITVVSKGHGKVSASSSAAVKGLSVSLSAVPDVGYLFERWEVTAGGVSISGNSFTMGSENVFINGYFYPINGGISL